MISILEMVLREYKEYLLLMIVDFTNENLDIETAFFFKNFLNITHTPSIRILHIH